MENTPQAAEESANDASHIRSSETLDHALVTEANSGHTSNAVPMRVSRASRPRRSRVFISDTPVACPLYKMDPLVYGGPRGCADWCTNQIHRVFAV